MSLEALDCNGMDSGREECWPPWVNIGVPVMMSIAFILILLIIFMVWPKKLPSSDEEEEDGQVFVPAKWVQNENTCQSGGSASGVSINNSRQVDENIL